MRTLNPEAYTVYFRLLKRTRVAFNSSNVNLNSSNVALHKVNVSSGGGLMNMVRMSPTRRAFLLG